MREQKWVRRSLRKLSQALQDGGFAASSMTVRRLLREAAYSLRANRKENGASHPERDRQFRYLAQVKRFFLEAGYPVIGVDMKKKELVGDFKNPGQNWCQEAERVNVHDFRSNAIGLAAPYGICDLRHNLGSVYVGALADTAERAEDQLSGGGGVKIVLISPMRASADFV